MKGERDFLREKGRGEGEWGGVEIQIFSLFFRLIDMQIHTWWCQREGGLEFPFLFFPNFGFEDVEEKIRSDRLFAGKEEEENFFEFGMNDVTRKGNKKEGFFLAI